MTRKIEEYMDQIGDLLQDIFEAHRSEVNSLEDEIADLEEQLEQKTELLEQCLIEKATAQESNEQG
jgi:hypothetical protein